MLGGIYTNEKCVICGRKMKDNLRGAVCCEIHPEQQSTRLRVYFKGITRRFSSYTDASRFLTGLRFKTDEGSFDRREYLKDNPVGFENLARLWIELRKFEVQADGISINTYRALKDHIAKATFVFGNKSVKTFRLRDFQMFLAHFSASSSKSKSNYLQTVKQFFRWLVENEDIPKMPVFPKVSYELKWRNTIDKATQAAVLDKVRELAGLKTWLGIRWMSVYFNARPEEIRSILEGDIDLVQEEIIIRHSKENRVKFLYLLPEDMAILRTLPKVIDKTLPFFRHPDGRQFGQKYFYKWWKRACKELNIEDVDLYGGTRHSTVRALRKRRTPEEIRRASGHSTNKAFERYYHTEGDMLRAIYDDAQGGKEVAKIPAPRKRT